MKYSRHAKDQHRQHAREHQHVDESGWGAWIHSFEFRVAGDIRPDKLEEAIVHHCRFVRMKRPIEATSRKFSGCMSSSWTRIPNSDSRCSTRPRRPNESMIPLRNSSVWSLKPSVA